MFTHGIFGFCIVDTIHSYPGPKYVYWYDYKANYSSQYEDASFDGFLGELKTRCYYILQLWDIRKMH